MFALLSFSGKIRRYPYALGSLGLFFSQHLIAILAFDIERRRLDLDWGFYVTPLRSLVMLSHAGVVSILALAYFLLVAWALAALAFRRAADANVSEWIAAAAVAPSVQIPAILWLCLAPSRPAASATPEAENGLDEVTSWIPAAQGVVAGMALTLLAVAVGALVFGTYGFGMFFVSPVVIGTVTGYFANRRGDIGAGPTIGLVFYATFLGGIALVLGALEGIVCIVMASPLALAVAAIGSLLGRAIALSTKRPARHTVSAFALLPLVFAIEAVFPAVTTFDTYQTITVEAPPATVWKYLLRMDEIDGPLALPFRLGVAYPIRGEIVGEGIGALRYGEFSTGTAVERVTEWVPERKLAFVIEKDIPAMRELSPYAHVHAPHVLGYFRTLETSFELVELPQGRTEIVERTSHALRLDPILYWLPLARWVVGENNARVLAHIRRQAERSSGGNQASATE
jgi:uncharacterized membrane protein YhaH (DUF805 family)